MARATTVWEIARGTSEPRKLPEGSIDVEKTLEDWVEKHPDSVEPGLTVIARQFMTDGGPLDLLCLDSDGRLVIVELKRADAYRVALAQVLDYAACIALLSYEELQQQVDVNRKKYEKHGSFDEILQKVVGDDAAEDWTPDAAEPRLVLVGTGADASLRRIVDYMTAKYDLPVNGVFFDVSMSSSGSSILVRSAVVADEQAAQQGRRRGRGGVTHDELLSLARDQGVETFVGPILEIWRSATGREGRPERGGWWTLGTRADGRTAAAWLHPYDKEARGKARLKLAKAKLMNDLKIDEPALLASFAAANIAVVDEVWIELAAKEDVDTLVAWVRESYALAMSRGGTLGGSTSLERGGGSRGTPENVGA